MIRLRLVILLIIFSMSSAIAQINLDKLYIEIQPSWQIGEQHTYHSESKGRYTHRQKADSSLATCDIDVKVVKIDDESIIVDYTYKNYKYQSSNPQSQMYGDLESIINNCTIRVVLDEGGAFVKIENLKQVSKHLRKGIKAIEAKVKSINDSAYATYSRSKKMLDRMQKLARNRDWIESESIEEILLLNYFNSIAYPRYDSIDVAVDVPNHHGDKPFTARQISKVVSTDINNQTATLRSERKVESDQLQAAMISNMQKHNMNIDSENMPQTTNENITTAVINTKGWTENAESTNTVIYGKMERSSVCKIYMEK